ncbi:hypothetical protein CIB95_06560 [Lottiidibacillus patelloidae]|uniref:DUF4227 domain-containing protein n=1 Tax=Lottiidibacillus patelloidae TaxID=2670334 RepID=A0A263BUX1_9BACI|nr:YqzK family protein [Lottiidibacillus patelloidae]OZM57127.1 hypothetical protein CIB95_06560 [Lottiidibacillus patelloidae]
MSQFFNLLYDTIKVFIFFVAFTLLFYYGIVWLNDEYEGYHKYDQPQGGAVKVIGNKQEEVPVFSLKRLYFYYHYGE